MTAGNYVRQNVKHVMICFWKCEACLYEKYVDTRGKTRGSSLWNGTLLKNVLQGARSQRSAEAAVAHRPHSLYARRSRRIKRSQRCSITRTSAQRFLHLSISISISICRSRSISIYLYVYVSICCVSNVVFLLFRWKSRDSTREYMRVTSICIYRVQDCRIMNRLPKSMPWLAKIMPNCLKVMCCFSNVVCFFLFGRLANASAGVVSRLQALYTNWRLRQNGSNTCDNSPSSARE